MIIINRRWKLHFIKFIWDDIFIFLQLDLNNTLLYQKREEKERERERDKWRKW